MTQLYLAYSHENTKLADQIAAHLYGIECIRHTDSGLSAGQFAHILQESDKPVVLLITDNFMKNEQCMTGVLPMLLSLLRHNRILPVIADGVIEKDGQTIPVETHIDRVINAIQYMNFWQQAYLTASDQYNHATDDERPIIHQRLQVIHSIADQTGEFISALRDADILKWQYLEEGGFTDIFIKLGIPQPPPQEITAPVPTAVPVLEIESPPAATPPATTLPPIAGPVWFKPADPLPVQTPEPPTAPISPTTPHTDNDLGQYQEQEIQHTIQDAWGWIERGNRELGVEILRLAVEQYPFHIQLQDELEKALGMVNIEVTEITDFEQEANSYEAAGDSALQDEDYLMAKYCWDRAAESNPNQPGIWRKLGLLTSEQLTGYTETSIIYLRKALEQNPDDQQVIERLTALGAIELPQPTQNIPEEPLPFPAPIAVDEPISPTHTEVPDIAQEPTEPLAPIPSVEWENGGHDETIPTETPETEVMDLPEEIPVSEPFIAVSEPQPTAETTPIPVRRSDIVMITGATSGIGKATAIEFARHGYRIIITGRRADRLLALKAQLEQDYQSEVLTLEFDVRHEQAVADALLHLPEHWQAIDILINNAGLAKGLSPIHEGNLDHWETMIDTNVKGLLYVSRIVSQGMVQRRKGHIVNLGSSAGKETYANGNVYCATKFAVEALTRSMRIDLHQYNIRVSQVSPGHVEETEFAINRFDGDAERARIYDDFQPLKASDVAEAIWFIASRPAHVNIQDVYMFGTQQASATVVDRSGRK